MVALALPIRSTTWSKRRRRRRVAAVANRDFMDANEDELLQELKANPDRVGAILESYRDRLRRMLRLRMDPRVAPRVDASDILQEAFVEVTQRLSYYLEDAKLPFFLWVRYLTAQKLLQVHRHHLDAGRRDAKREQRVSRVQGPDATSMSMASLAVDEGVSPSQHVAREEAVQQIHDALEGMSETDREVIALRHFEHLSNGEVAALLRITEATASARYVRAAKRLSDTLQKLGMTRS